MFSKKKTDPQAEDLAIREELLNHPQEALMMGGVEKHLKMILKFFRDFVQENLKRKLNFENFKLNFENFICQKSDLEISIFVSKFWILHFDKM